MTTHTTTRIAAAGLLTAAAVLTASGAQALQTYRPDPSPAFRLSQPGLQDKVAQLLDEGRRATTVGERRLVHHDLVQTVRDGE